MPRLFTGLEIPAEIGHTLSNLRGGLPGARWIDPENYHVTLRFIGDIDGIAANEIASMLFRINRKPFEVALQGLSSFGGKKPRAVVASPSDGWVAFSGPYRTYGQLLIINAGGGYYVVLAGMERINVEVGQFVLAGEPVALMGDGSAKTAAAIAIGATQPIH